MARVQYGAQIVNMSGKLGGQVYSHNAAGAYVRNIGTIAVAPSPGIIASRARFATVIAAWKALTQTQRTAWNAATVNYVWFNVFGQPYTPNGYALFTSVNNNLLMAGVGMLTMPSQPVQPSAIVGLVLSQAVGIGSPLQIDGAGAVPAGTAWLLDCTANISPTIFNVNVLLSQLTAVPPAAVMPYSINAAYVAKYGALVSAQKIVCRVTPINLNCGSPGQPVFSSLIIP